MSEWARPFKSCPENSTMASFKARERDDFFSWSNRLSPLCFSLTVVQMFLSVMRSSCIFVSHSLKPAVCSVSHNTKRQNVLFFCCFFNICLEFNLLRNQTQDNETNKCYCSDFFCLFLFVFSKINWKYSCRSARRSTTDIGVNRSSEHKHSSTRR